MVYIHNWVICRDIKNVKMDTFVRYYFIDITSLIYNSANMLYIINIVYVVNIVYIVNITCQYLLLIVLLILYVIVCIVNHCYPVRFPGT